ncbi:serine/threonine-protein phosphatase 2A activator [Bradysia coprophila]|uniref:serine/threonine-protein phosphatase 2A activator n=1 Tax=Bradysia coprophila TaxID=38358 RepID=UPI00187D8ED9|nr:serine/threonine-protein phosphatase 2A activator [Bradysia coprophila]
MSVRFANVDDPAAAASSQHDYVIPTKCVKNMGDMAMWEKSEAYYDIVGFINSISNAVQGIKNTVYLEQIPVVQKLLELFEKLSKMVDDTPPIDQPQRFGNKAYRDWFEKMKTSAKDLLEDVLPEELHPAIVEIGVYFTESFGNSTRIDYGTGHELSFIMFLCCLFKIGALTELDKTVTGVKIFNSYLIFVRKLQLTYRMEPAGSHGVWSLDDFQFVPFIWGSAQFAVDSPIRPNQFLEEKIIKDYKDHYMFISCIDYINKVKIGNFAEHSNQLWGISSVPTWTKINSGLVKMYQKELLGKFPVVQHIVFGSLMQFKSVPPGKQLPSARLGMLAPN